MAEKRANQIQRLKTHPLLQDPRRDANGFYCFFASGLAFLPIGNARGGGGSYQKQFFGQY